MSMSLIVFTYYKKYLIDWNIGNSNIGNLNIGSSNIGSLIIGTWNIDAWNIGTWYIMNYLPGLVTSATTNSLSSNKVAWM